MAGPTTIEHDVAALLGPALARFAVPGAQLGLLSGTSRIVVSAGHVGLGASSPPIVRDTRFHAGSIAKAVTAMLVLRAAREGWFSLDEPCSASAPTLWDDTPRALLAQTTGRPNVLPAASEDLATYLANVGALPRVHAPGRFSYCNPGWAELDALLGLRGGRPFESLARDVLGSGAMIGMPNGAAGGHVVVGGHAVAVAESDLGEAALAAGARFWVNADQLLDLATLHLDDGEGSSFHPEDIRAQRAASTPMPGATVADAWGLGWGVWDRGAHQGFGWFGLTPGYRAYLRCFPEQHAAVVLLTNSAGSYFGGMGGNALFDAILPDVLELLNVPPVPVARRLGEKHDPRSLAGSYGPITVIAEGDEGLALTAPALGVCDAVRLVREGGNTFVVADGVPGALAVAVDEGVLFVGPFGFAGSASG